MVPTKCPQHRAVVFDHRRRLTRPHSPQPSRQYCMSTSDDDSSDGQYYGCGGRRRERSPEHSRMSHGEWMDSQMHLHIQLEDAARSNNVDYAKNIIECAADDLNVDLTSARVLEEQRNESGNSLVWLASRAGSTEMVKYLVSERGLDVAEPGWDMGGRCVDDGCYSEHGWESWEYDVIGGSSPFFIAAQYGNTSTAAALVELGASPLTVRNDGSSPCLMATKVGNVSTLSALLELGACPQTARNDGQTPFFFAAKSGSLAMVRVLHAALAAIDDGDALVDAMAANDDGLSPMHAALQASHLEVARYLRDSCGGRVDEPCRELSFPDESISFSDITIDGGTLLHLEAAEGNANMVRHLLVEFGCGATLADDHGQTAMHWAARGSVEPYTGYMEVVKALLEHGANVNAEDEDGCRPLELAAAESPKWPPAPHVPAMVRFLVLYTDSEFQDLMDEELEGYYHEPGAGFTDFLGRVVAAGGSSPYLRAERRDERLVYARLRWHMVHRETAIPPELLATLSPDECALRCFVFGGSAAPSPAPAPETPPSSRRCPAGAFRIIAKFLPSSTWKGRPVTKPRGGG